MTIKDLILHLRLNISIVLAPIFLWGILLAEGKLSLKTVIGFIAFHIFLYGASNAYNSFYDKDEGPIGGLINPPKVSEKLLYFSLLVKTTGLIISWFINLPFFVTYLIFFLMSLAYSHPITRWKANPYFSVMTIGIGQGGLAFVAGWFSVSAEISNYSLFYYGMFTTIFMSMGIYPLTQLYQIEEDRKRNDRTFAVYWGIKKSFGFSFLCVVLSCLAMLMVLKIQDKTLHLFIISGFYSFFILRVYLWSKNYNEKAIMENYAKIMKLNYSNAGGFTLYILASLLKII